MIHRHAKGRVGLCLWLVVAPAGCAPYTQVKRDLVEQSRLGVRLARESLDRRQQVMEDLLSARRRQVDAAFDADARAATLSPQWVIDARRAYAVAIDAAHAQADASRQAHAAAVANLDAVERALAQLQWLHDLERWLSVPEITP